MMIADTDVLILQGDQAASERIALELDHGQPATTATSRFERLAGAWTLRLQTIIGQLPAARPCLPLEAQSADRAAEVRRTLEGQGLNIGMGDSPIAGIVLAHRGVLLTRNRRPSTACRVWLWEASDGPRTPTTRRPAIPAPSGVRSVMRRGIRAPARSR
jgi:predicted nucleic acid-binding protein